MLPPSRGLVPSPKNLVELMYLMWCYSSASAQEDRLREGDRSQGTVVIFHGIVAENIEWFIKDQAFSLSYDLVIWLIPPFPHPPSRQQVSLVELTNGREWGEEPVPRMARKPGPLWIIWWSLGELATSRSLSVYLRTFLWANLLLWKPNVLESQLPGLLETFYQRLKLAKRIVLLVLLRFLIFILIRSWWRWWGCLAGCTGCAGTSTVLPLPSFPL